MVGIYRRYFGRGSTRTTSATVTTALVTLALLASTTTATAQTAADNGFIPEQNGFSFPNYGAGNQDLTSEQMRLLFGDRVCSGPNSGGGCLLTPEAETWMNDQNESMEGGHCFGFAAVAQRFFEDVAPDQSLFGASTTPALQIMDNPELQSYLAYAWSTQALPAVARTETNFTPSKTADFLAANLRPGEDQFIVIIYGEDGGHAVTPISVERVSPIRQRVGVYDNNWPDQIRYIEVNTKADTWAYQLAPGMSWEGTANSKTFQVEDANPGFKEQPCFICPSSGKLSRGKTAELRLTSNQISGRHGSLVAVDGSGRRAGFSNRKEFNGIPGVEIRRPVTGSLKPWRTNTPPVLILPTKRSYEVRLGASSAKSSENISLIGRGTSLSVAGIELKRGEEDVLVIGKRLREVSFDNDNHQVESPTLTLTSSAVRGGKDFRFDIQAQGINRGAGVSVELNSVKRKLTITNRAGSKVEKFDLGITTYSVKGETNGSATAKVKRGKSESFEF